MEGAGAHPLRGSLHRGGRRAQGRWRARHVGHEGLGVRPGRACAPVLAAAHAVQADEAAHDSQGPPADVHLARLVAHGRVVAAHEPVVRAWAGQPGGRVAIVRLERRWGQGGARAAMLALLWRLKCGSPSKYNMVQARELRMGLNSKAENVLLPGQELCAYSALGVRSSINGSLRAWASGRRPLPAVCLSPRRSASTLKRASRPGTAIDRSIDLWA